MSADADFTMTTPALLAAAEQYQACATFRIEQGGSRHYCADCRETEVVHVLVALRKNREALIERQADMLLTLRNITDAFDGYRGRGVSRPSMWHAYSRQSRATSRTRTIGRKSTSAALQS